MNKAWILLIFVCMAFPAYSKTEEEKRRRNSLRAQRRTMRAAKKKNSTQAVNVVLQQVSITGEVIESPNADMPGYDVLDRKLLRGISASSSVRTDYDKNSASYSKTHDTLQGSRDHLGRM